MIQFSVYSCLIIGNGMLHAIEPTEPPFLPAVYASNPNRMESIFESITLRLRSPPVQWKLVWRMEIHSMRLIGMEQTQTHLNVMQIRFISLFSREFINLEKHEPTTALAISKHFSTIPSEGASMPHICRGKLTKFFRWLFVTMLHLFFDENCPSYQNH